MAIWRSPLSSKAYPHDVENFLLKFLSPTTPGTNYWDSPSEAALSGLTKREVSRICIQVEEIESIIEKYQISNDFNFLDVGTGNGLVPSLLTALHSNISAVGIDPFLHGGHKTSWMQSNLLEELSNCFQEYLKRNPDSAKTSYNQNDCNYTEKCLYLCDYLASSQFKSADLVYMKAIEHVPSWSDVASELSKTLSSNGILVIKHRPFYSLLGPHRYATTGIPWGHCLLSDDEYRIYAKEEHSERASSMVESYFNDLSYPRMPISHLINQFKDDGLLLLEKSFTAPKYMSDQDDLIRQMPDHFESVQSSNPDVELSEFTCATVTLVFRKV